MKKEKESLADSVPVLGIDLGTTYSCTAWIREDGKPEVLKNAEGALTTPSVVCYESADEIIVGEDAKESARSCPEQVVSFAKRQMGKNGASIHAGGRTLAPQEVSAAILRKVVNDAAATLKEEGKIAQDTEIRKVVITVPAYFGIEEKNATREAGLIAGLEVLNIINEPTAAAIAYGVLNHSETKNILVYDLGGGTFDVTIIHIEPGVIRVVCTGGDHTLGGKDWDDKILGWIDGQVQETLGPDASIFNDPQTLQEVRLSAEKAKKTLTSKTKASIPVVSEQGKIKLDLTREIFDSLTRPLLENTISLTKDMFKEAEKKGVRPADISEILLVGGSSRMPQVARRLEEVFSSNIRAFDPDEAVAKGAALYARSKVLIEEDGDLSGVGAMQITDVSSRSFGTIALDPATRKPLLCNLILKNDDLPAVFEQTFATMDASTSRLEIKIMESTLTERTAKPEDGREVGVVELKMEKPLPQNTGIWLKYTLNPEGLLEVEAKEMLHQTSVQASFQTRNGMTDDALASSQHLLLSSNIL